MSRIGKQPIELPASVNVSLSPGRVMVNGPLGELTQDVPARMQIEQNDGSITVTRPTERGDDRALHGLTRTLIANMVEGVTKGFEKRLELQGVGYRATLQGADLRLVVSRSNRGISAQLVDDMDGKTLAAASWLQLKSFKGKKSDQAAEVGKLLAENARTAGIEVVVFDRGGYLYHGRVKALAQA